MSEDADYPNVKPQMEFPFAEPHHMTVGPFVLDLDENTAFTILETLPCNILKGIEIENSGKYTRITISPGDGRSIANCGDHIAVYFGDSCMRIIDRPFVHRITDGTNAVH